MSGEARSSASRFSIPPRFSLFERPVLLPSLSRNLTSIFSVKKASINKDESVDMSEDQAALMIQKGRERVKKKKQATKEI